MNSILIAKQDLEKYTEQEITTLAQYYDINSSDYSHEDLLWIIAINNMHTIQRAEQPSAFEEFADYLFDHDKGGFILVIGSKWDNCITKKLNMPCITILPEKVRTINSRAHIAYLDSFGEHKNDIMEHITDNKVQLFNLYFTKEFVYKLAEIINKPIFSYIIFDSGFYPRVNYWQGEDKLQNVIDTFITLHPLMKKNGTIYLPWTQLPFDEIGDFDITRNDKSLQNQIETFIHELQNYYTIDIDEHQTHAFRSVQSDMFRINIQKWPILTMIKK